MRRRDSRFLSWQLCLRLEYEKGALPRQFQIKSRNLGAGPRRRRSSRAPTRWALTRSPDLAPTLTPTTSKSRATSKAIGRRAPSGGPRPAGAIPDSHRDRMHAAADLGLVRFMKLVIPRPERTRDCGMTMKMLPRRRLSLRLEFLVGKWRLLRSLDDNEGVVSGDMAGVASRGELAIGLVELLCAVPSSMATSASVIGRDIAASTRSGTGSPFHRGTACETTKNPCRSSFSA